MSSDQILDTSRQKIVTRVFIFVWLLIFGFSFLPSFGINFGRITEFLTIYSPVIILVVSAIFGSAAKRAIDYLPGRWDTKKVYVSFPEYEEMAEKHEDAYGHLFARPGIGCACLCEIIVIFVITFAVFTLISMSPPIFHPTIDFVLWTAFLDITAAAIGYVTGFKIPKIDAEEFFKKPPAGDEFEFFAELARVPGVRAGVNVTIGDRAGLRAIFDAEPRAYIEGLPETAQIQVKVSRSGFVYPYIIATFYKGPRVTKHTERVHLGRKYPALFEYSMDKDVAVIVGRYDIPSKTSSVPHISFQDFRVLAAETVARMKEIAARTENDSS